MTASRISLGEAAYRRLRTDIVSCRLAPGRRFTEKELAKETGFGTSPLREALTRLDQEGMIRTLPRKGYEVTRLTPKSVGDLLELWELIAPELLRRGVARGTLEQKQRVAAGFEELDRVGRGPPGYATAVRLVEVLDEMFAVLAQAGGNDYLIGWVQRLSGDLARIWVIILSVEPSAAIGDPIDFWSRNLVIDQDADAVAESARRYIALFRERVLQIVARWPSVERTEIVPLHPHS